jgi:hypothetical protein
MADAPDEFTAKLKSAFDSGKVVSAPLGAASPLWLAFGAAATVGAAWWWLTRWMRPSNLEAVTADAMPAEPVVAPTAETVAVVEVAPSPVAEPAKPVIAKAPPKAKPAVKVAAAKKAVSQPVAKTAAAPKPATQKDIADKLVAKRAAAKLAPPVKAATKGKAPAKRKAPAKG